MIGILAEKPSAARNMAKALGGASGTYNGEQYQIVAARGHIYELVDPDKQVPPAFAQQYASWDLQYLPWDESIFKWKYALKKDTPKTPAGQRYKDLVDNIEKVFGKCNEVCIATDDDPTGEGQLLAWEVLRHSKNCPRKVTRMYFIDESVKELQKAFKNRVTLPPMEQDPEYRKSFFRQRLDFLTMQETRVATRCGDGHSVLRCGRLKSVMVKAVGDQLKLVAAYKPVPFFQNRFKDNNGVIYTNPNEPTYPDKKQVPNTYSSSPVTLDSKQMKSTPPPKLMDLAALSARLAPKGMSAKAVQDTYQKMYESQIVSYPRTEDKVITPEQFDELLPLVNKIAAVVGVDTKYLTHRTARATHVKTGGAHGANRPGTNVPKALADLDSFDKGGKGIARAIYQALATNYLAMLAEDYEYEAQKGHVTNYPDFVGNAQVPKKMGWKLVFNDDADVDPNDNAKGIGTQADPFVHEGYPPKPANPTMKWLMKYLEKHDVGTGATRTSTYAEVTNAKATYPLLKDTKGKITMTVYGQMCYLLIDGTKIASIEVTEEMQRNMREIGEGKKDPEVCLKAVQQMVLDDMKVMKENSPKIRKELNIMAGEKKEKYTGIWNGKEVSFNREWSQHKFTDDECERLCAGEDITIEAVSAKTGNKFKCHGVLADDLTFKDKEGKDRQYTGFKNLGFVNDVNKSGIPKKWCEHVFTDEEMTNLEAGLSVEREDWFSKNKNKTFKATIKWNPDEKKFDFV